MFQHLLELLQATGIPFEAYAWSVAPSGTYGVVSLDSAGDTVFGDGHLSCQAVEGTVDLFLKDVATTNPQIVQGVLDDLDGCAWQLNSVQYEEDTGYIHWEWVYQLETL